MCRVIFITGVSGSGKTTIGQRLSHEIGWTFYDGDDFHPEENIEKMKSGTPLDDNDRRAWLESLNSIACRNEKVIIACSALKEKYRTQLSHALGENQYCFVHLRGSFDMIEKRMTDRQGHFMPVGLLRSQFDDYEIPTSGLILDVDQPINAMIENIVAMLRRRNQQAS